MVGISMLTLVPGLVGGSETYARELCRALARVGELEYRVFVPTIAPDAGDGLPTTVVPSTGRAARPPAGSRRWPARRSLQAGCGGRWGSRSSTRSTSRSA